MQALLGRTLREGARLGPRVVAAAGAAALGASQWPVAMDAPQSALSPSEFKAYKLVKIEPITHNTALYRCARGRRVAAPLCTR
jgi:hypothetical protein